MRQRILLSLVLISTMALMSASTTLLGYKVGDKAADFELKDISGEMVSMADFKNVEGYIVVFTCNHCPFAVLYEDRIIELQKNYGKEFPVIAIQPNDVEAYPSDSYDKMKERAKEKGFNFNYVWDENQEVAKRFGATRTPHFFLLDKNKVVRYIGALDDNPRDPKAVKKTYIEDAIKSIKEGQDVSTTETKAIGCTIKWKDA